MNIKLSLNNAVVVLLIALFSISMSAKAGDVYDYIKLDNEILIATDANWAPFSYIDDDGVMQGFDVDVGREIAKRMGVEARFITPAWDVITAGNWNMRWDVSVGSMTPTASRSEVLNFPATYYYTPAAFAVHEDSTLTVPQLTGKTICTTAASTWEMYLQGDLDMLNAPAFTYDVTPGTITSLVDGAACLDDVRLGAGVRNDGMIDSLPMILAAIDAGYPIKVLGDPAFYEPLSLATDKGNDDPELDAELARIITEMQKDYSLSLLSIQHFKNADGTSADYTVSY
ncbi:MAG: transporter substrate-binding domain-containing protein [Candidatus Thioglobus sp.]|jgi:polar amino acid transport system substrate-binding protein|nr:transporter substrate-binding domain-containing protein [Candidatus Thioglobus sp.]